MLILASGLRWKESSFQFILVLSAEVETLATVISVAVLCIMAAPTLQYMDYIYRFAIVFTFAEYAAVFSSRFDRTDRKSVV